MFKENLFEGENPIKHCLEMQDSVALIDFWTQSSELQEEIASSIYLISDNQLASQLSQFLVERYPETDEEERNRIITALDKLGARNLPVEISTTNFLAESYGDENALQIINALKHKVMRATLPTFSQKDIKQRLPIIKKAGELFLDILEKPNSPHEVCLKTLSGLARCENVPELRERIYVCIDRYIVSSDEQESLYAMGETSFLERKNPPLVSEGLKHKFESGWIDNASDEEVMQLISIAGHSGDSSLKAYILDLKIHPRFINDEHHQENIEIALKNLEEKL